MLAVAVCDDEVMENIQICKKIQEVLAEMHIPCTVRRFHSGEELLQSSEQFDLIFLDIIMQDMDGMETAKLCREKSLGKILIFLSSSREYVFESYEVEAFWYLVKPVDEKKLKHVLQRAVEKGKQKEQGFIIVNKEREKKKLFLEDIYYFEVRGRKISVHGKDDIFIYYEQLGSIEKTLCDKEFFRCHKSFLVNLRHISGYNRQEAVLDNGERILISRRRYPDFCEKMLCYMKRNGGIL